MLPSKYAENARYMSFLDACRLKSYSEDDFVQSHHIQPRYDNGPDDEWNLINLSIIDHWNAHNILFEEFGNLEDQAACDMIYGYFLGPPNPEEIIELKKRYSHRTKMLWKNEEYRKKHREGTARYWSDQTHYDEMRERMNNPKVKQKISDTLKKYFSDDNNVAKLKSTLNTSKVKKKRGASQKKTWKDPKVRKTRTDAMKASYTTEVRKSRGEATRKRWQDPEYRKRVAEAIKRGHNKSS